MLQSASSRQDRKTMIRGQLGMQFKSFGELKNNLDKLKTNFDLIVQGH